MIVLIGHFSFCNWEGKISRPVANSPAFLSFTFDDAILLPNRVSAELAKLRR
jgi:hypothetical protein